ncbi:hypothetical protein LEMLEM_LOCUS4239 [Lemmus lemmus]
MSGRLFHEAETLKDSLTFRSKNPESDGVLQTIRMQWKFYTTRR